MEMTGAQIVVECLKRENVKQVFGIPGGCLLPIFDAFYDSSVRVILTRHEQGAAHMADAFSRASGQVGVCLATSGPGATNLVTGLATAYMDSIPVVAITGQVRTDVIGSDAFQEADATGCTRSVTKHNYLVKDVRDLVRVIREAFYIARSGRPGPVHIDIPVDVQKTKAEFQWVEDVKIRSYRPIGAAPKEQVQKAAELFQKAKKPLLYAGGGVILSGAAELLKELAEKTGTPVASTLMANGAFPFDHPLYAGPLGMHGKYASNMAIQKCDLLISCGARFDDRVTGNLSTFSPNSKKIHFDIDPACIDKNVTVDAPVIGDLKMALAEFIKILPKNSHPEWLKELDEWERKHPLSYKLDEGSFVKPQFVIQKLHEITKGDAVVATGVGQHQMWAMQWYPCRSPRQFITSGGLGTMGFGFPAALGAKLARPDKTVVCIDGDGSLQMTMTEMATAMLEKINVVVIVINNYYLGMVRQWQELFYKERYSGTALTAASGKAAKDQEADPAKLAYTPDFVKWAEAYGAKGLRITKNDQVESALREALKSPVPVLLEVIVHPEEKVFPMIPAGAGVDDIIVDMA
ncbi:MAG: biosynthetic-type acetolactate synthase large subunit [Elusimicrobia bacterium]|nr:biosynthetic-type acetolactate synthase large subunit [Elusimicrobiota bacterium]